MGISVWQLLILLAVVVLLFGTKRLRNIGSDLGSAIKGFKNSMEDDPEIEKKAESETKTEEKNTEQSKN